MLQALVYDSEGVVKSYSKFKQDAKEVSDIVQETWLRVEYENCRRQSTQSEEFNQMREDKDLYPYWIYRGMMDDREREEHVEMEGQTFRIGDTDGDACFPPNDWNCRCDGESADGDQIDEEGLKVNSNSESKELLQGKDKDGKDFVDEQFRYNPADQGMMPRTGSYFNVMSDANKGNAKYFGLPDIESSDELEGFSSRLMLDAKGLHAVIETINEWRGKYKTDEKHNIIFSNKELFTNVRFNNNSLQAIQKHSRGFENVPEAIKNPDEVWMQWQNEDSQKVVLRNYILFGKTCYIVQTKDGFVTDAFAVSKLKANKYRKGVIN